MPLVSVHRGSRGGPGYLSGGTQYVDGALTLPASPWTIKLANTIYPATGTYVLFDYANGTFNGLNLNHIQFDFSDLTLSGAAVLTDVPAEQKVLMSLKSSPTNGTQYVEGTLDIPAGGMTIRLRNTLYATDGYFVLFRFPNGYSVTGSLADLNVVPPAGRSLLLPPYQSGNDIMIQLG